MITFHKGNLFDAKVDAYVNTVNCVGVMGKGIALECKHRYPKVYNEYRSYCFHKKLLPGNLLIIGHFISEGHDDNRLIINFATKDHWRYPSKIEWIEKGLQALRTAISNYQLKSIAIPPLGCGNGGLSWNEVKPLIAEALKELEGVDIRVYEP